MFKRTGMPFHFHQLDNKTREIMKEELEMDLDGNGHYQSPRLTSEGLRQFPDFLKEAIESGNDISFSNTLRPYYKSFEFYIRKGRQYKRKISSDAHLVLGQGQFNIYYMRAICQIALSQGIKEVEIYRGKQSKEPRRSSQVQIGSKLDASKLLNELRNTSEFGSKEFQIGLPNSGLSLKF